MRPKGNFFMVHATGIAIATISFLMALAAYVFYQQSQTVETARQWVNHTYEVEGHTQALFNKLQYSSDPPVTASACLKLVSAMYELVAPLQENSRHRVATAPNSAYLNC